MLGGETGIKRNENPTYSLTNLLQTHIQVHSCQQEKENIQRGSTSNSNCCYEGTMASVSLWLVSQGLTTGVTGNWVGKLRNLKPRVAGLSWAMENIGFSSAVIQVVLSLNYIADTFGKAHWPFKTGLAPVFVACKHMDRHNWKAVLPAWVAKPLISVMYNFSWIKGLKTRDVGRGFLYLIPILTSN